MPRTLRDDIITWNFTAHSKEFQDNIKIDRGIPSNIREKNISLIQNYWDAFDEGGVSRPVISYEFCIDTGTSPPVYCRLPCYGIHEIKIMNKQIKTLEDNNGIIDCDGAWGSMILLAPKPHQEGINNIDDFVWRLCVSYRRLNSVTKSFLFPIPRYAESIEDFGDSNGPMFFITLNAR